MIKVYAGIASVGFLVALTTGCSSADTPDTGSGGMAAGGTGVVPMGGSPAAGSPSTTGGTPAGGTPSTTAGTGGTPSTTGGTPATGGTTTYFNGVLGRYARLGASASF